MTLKELKESIEDRTFRPSSMILLSDDKFIPLQYVEELKKFPKQKIIYIESLNELDSGDDIFSDPGSVSSDDVYVLNTQIVDFCEEIVYNKNNIFIIANKISPESRSFYRDIIIEVPKILDWQIKDLAYTFGKGIDQKHLDWFIQCCGGDINRIYNESSKFELFNEHDRQKLFMQMCDDGAFDDLVTNTIFNFTNAISKKDIGALTAIYHEIENMDTNGFGLLTILLNNFQTLLQIQMGVSPTPEKLGMKPNQFNAIKRNCGIYSNTSLIKIISILSDMDRRIKLGEFPTNIMRDYMVMSILSC